MKLPTYLTSLLLFRRLVGKERLYSIVVSQYIRGIYGLGDEEQLHWSILVLTNEQKLEGRVYQILTGGPQSMRNRTTWELDIRDKVSLHKSFRSLGGVSIGSIRERQFDHLHRVCSPCRFIVTRRSNSRPTRTHF